MRTEFLILGPLEVVGDAGAISLPPGRSRAVLMLLLLHANETLTLDRIVDELWNGREPPPTAGKIVQGYVSQLRRVLGEDRIVTRGHGYRLVLAAGELDVDAVAGLRARAHEEAPEQAASTLREALARFRGTPLEDAADEPFARMEAARLDELRLALVRERVDVDLALGRHAAVVPELEALVANNPLDENLRRQLMLALYRCGRQAEALSTYRDTRRVLADELGLEPSTELRELERQILGQDPALQPPRRVAAPSAREPSGHPAMVPPRRPHLVVAGAGALLAAAGVLALVLALGRDDRLPTVLVPANSVAVVDPERNTVVAAVPVGQRPVDIVAGAGAVWAANTADRTLSRIDPSTFRVTATVGLGFEPTGLAATEEHVWVAGGFDHVLWRVDRDGVSRLRLGFAEELGPLPAGWEKGPATLAVGEGWLWLAHGIELSRLDSVTGVGRGSVRVGGRWPAAVAAGAERAFVGGGAGQSADPTIDVIDASSLRKVGQLRLRAAPSAVLVATGFVWAAVWLADSLWQIDATDLGLVRAVDIGQTPTALAFVDRAIWVASEHDRVVRRVDPDTGEVVAVVDVEHTPEGIASSGGLLWVTVRAP